MLWHSVPSRQEGHATQCSRAHHAPKHRHDTQRQFCLSSCAAASAAPS